MIKHIRNKNTIITANPGGGATTLLLYYINTLCITDNILFYDTGLNIDRVYITSFYKNMYDNVYFIQSSNEIFFNYLIELGDKLKLFKYIVLDTADSFGKTSLFNIYQLLELYDINIIVTSQLRVNPNNSKPYSTVEEWNKQYTDKIFDNSIWIRNVNEPNMITRRKYIDIYNQYRRGNKYDYRYLLEFDKKRGNIL